MHPAGLSGLAETQRRQSEDEMRMRFSRGKYRVSWIAPWLLAMAAAVSLCGQDSLSVGALLGGNPDGYVLGPGDEVRLWVFGIDEVADQVYRLDASGILDVPYLGQIQAAGKTVKALRDELRARAAKYVLEPEVSVNVLQRRSRPVSVLGAVRQPGVYQLDAPRPLLEVLSMAGGITEEAGYSVRIATEVWRDVLTEGGNVERRTTVETREVDLKPLLRGESPENNVLVYPNSVVSVPRADMTFVIGAVMKPGAIVLADEKSVSVLQALSAAGGFTEMAAPGKAKILRIEEGRVRREIPVDLKKVMKGKTDDIAMYAGDVLFVPTSTMKQVRQAAFKTSLAILAGVIIWRR